MRTMGSMAMVLGSITLAGMLSGCGSLCNREEITEINRNVQRQQDEITKLRTLVEANSELLKKMTAVNTAEQDMRTKMVDAALLLAENGSENVPSQAINILGYVGGEKAETALLNMLDTKPSQAHSIIQALANMRSKKIHDVVIRMLQNGDTNRLNNVINVVNNGQFSIFTEEDLPIMEKILASFPDNDYNNNRYIRNSLIGVIIRIAPEKGVKYVCDALAMTTDSYRKRDLLYQLSSHNTKIKLSDWRMIIDCLGPISAMNSEAYSAVLNGIQRSGDWRVTDIILPWAEFAKTNRNFGNQYLSTLTQMRDPKAAAVVVELMKNKEMRSYGRINDFPGIKQENNECVLVSDAELEKLIANRNKIVERLNEMEKKQVDAKK